MSDCMSEGIENWLKEVREEQQSFCDALGDRHYDAHSSDEIKYLDLKIGNAFFGPPKRVDENQNEVMLSNYELDQQILVEKVRDLILKKSNDRNVRVAFIFVSVKQYSKRFTLPVIRFLDPNDKVLFIDHEVRLYEGWQNFLSENLYPKCIYCYPSNGVYEVNQDNDVILGHGTSPSCALEQELIKVADGVSTVALLGSLGMTVGAMLFPPAVPLLIPAATWSGIGSGAYSVVRNASKLRDRQNHEQSVNPFTDPEARGCWFSCVGGALGMGSMGLLKYTRHLARNGEIARTAVRVAYSCCEGGSLTVNGLGVISHAYELYTKEDKVTVGDVASLSLSMLFFAHACVNLKSANTIIKDVQASVIADVEGSLSKKQKVNFKKLLKNSVGENTMEGNARIIKSLKHVENLEDFLKNTNAIQRRAGGNHDFKLVEKGIISINDQLNIHPNKMVTISRESRKKLIECAQKLNSNPSDASKFLDEVRTICKRERINFEFTRQETVSKMCHSLGVRDLADFKINGKKIFEDIQPHEVDRIGSVMENSGRKYDQHLLKVVEEFAAKNDCSNTDDFCSFVEYIDKFMLNHKEQFQNVPKKQRYQEILAQLKNPESGMMDKMLEDFVQLKNEVSRLNAGAAAPFASNNQATYHYYKHHKFGQTELTPSEYFEMLADNFENVDLRRCSSLTQEGSKVFVTVTDPRAKVKLVIIEPVLRHDSSAVYTATFMYNSRL